MTESLSKLKRIVVLDSETDGLAYVCTKLHVVSWTDDGENYQSTNNYDKMREVLNNADLVVCHNAVGFDLVVFNRLLHLNLSYTKFVDSLALSWFLYPERSKHGLESHGKDLGVVKPKIGDWENLTYDTYKYRCEEDVKINWLLWKKMEARLLEIYGDDTEGIFKFLRYLSFKMDCLREQEEHPLTLDVEATQEYINTLEAMKLEKTEALSKSMPKKPILKSKAAPAKPYKADGSLSSNGEKWFEFLKSQNLPKTTVGPVNYIDSYEEGNPNSPDQVKEWLYSLGWKPETFKFVKNKDTGEERKIEQVRDEGVLCDSVLKLKDKDPAIELLDGLTVITHRLGIFKGYMNAQKDGLIVAGAGGFTNTLRLKHRAPLVNLPSVSSAYGDWVRGVITSPSGKFLCGADVSSLEDMTKRHYMYPLDPDYVEAMSIEGFDAHLDLAKFAGAVTQEDIDKHVSGVASLKSVRSKYKAANYSCIYGVGPPKLSRSIGCSVGEAKALIEAYWERNWAIKKVAKDQYVKTLSDGTMWLKNSVSGFYYSLRYDKDRWSTTNQGTGVFVFDLWVLFCRAAGLKISLQYHDEVLFVVDKSDESRVATILHESMKKVNDYLKLNVNITIEEKFGDTYASVH